MLLAAMKAMKAMTLLSPAMINGADQFPSLFPTHFIVIMDKIARGAAVIAAL